MAAYSSPPNSTDKLSLRSHRFGQNPKTFWLTGLPAAGKSTLAAAVEPALSSRGFKVALLDGDALRLGINCDLGFTDADRTENIRRAAEICRLFNDNGLTVIASFISPHRKMRDLAKTIIGADRYREVFIQCPIEVCEQRDPNGLYARARKGEIAQFTGVSAPYEAPQAPALTLATDKYNVEECAALLGGTILSEISVPRDEHLKDEFANL